MHGHASTPELSRIPLVLVAPGLAPARRNELAHHVDVMPTLLELAGLSSAAGGMQGRSLAPVLAGDARVNPERPIFLYRRLFEPGRVNGLPVAGEKFGVRLGAFKLVLGPEEGTRELFDVLHDPRERENLAGAEPARAAELEKRIADWRAEYERDVTAPEAISTEDLERLRALGYKK